MALTYFQLKPDPFTFNVNFNARLGSNPIWKHIPLEKIAHPPFLRHFEMIRISDESDHLSLIIDVRRESHRSTESPNHRQNSQQCQVLRNRQHSGWLPIRPILRTASQSALDMPYEPVTNDDAVDIIA